MAKEAVNKQSRSGRDFVPSTGNEDYLKTADEKKVAKTQELEVSLQELAVVINSTYATGISFAQKATQEMIKCGQYLQQARDKFKGDKEFGQWREKHIEFGQTHCARLMAVAREFGENEDAMYLPVSTLSELLPAPPEVKQEVIADAKAAVEKGEKVPTREEVKQKKRDAKKKDSSTPEGEQENVAGKPVRPDTKNGAVKTLEPWEIAQEILMKPFPQRLDQVEVRGKGGDELYGAHLIFGLVPYYDGIYSIEVIHSLWHAYTGEHGDWLQDNPDLEDRFTVAYDTLLTLY